MKGDTITLMILAFGFLLISCAKQNSFSDSKPSGVDYSKYISLAQILQNHPGVSIWTYGNEVRVYVKTFVPHGTHGTPLGFRPLFVVDGMWMGTDFGGVNAIPTSDIASVRVLRELGQLSKYGMQGNNGVILIYTKTASK